MHILGGGSLKLHSQKTRDRPPCLRHCKVVHSIELDQPAVLCDTTRRRSHSHSLSLSCAPLAELTVSCNLPHHPFTGA